MKLAYVYWEADVWAEMRSPRKGLEVIAGCEDLKADPLSHTLKFSSHSSTARFVGDSLQETRPLGTKFLTLAARFIHQICPYLSESRIQIQYLPFGYHTTRSQPV